MRKVFVLSVLAVLAVVGCFLFEGIKQKQPPESVGEEKFAAETVAMPMDMLAYLQNSPKYAKYYAEGKNFVVYCVGEKCGYPQAFDEAIVRLMQKQDDHNFIARSVDEKMDFLSERERDDHTNFLALCSDFCVVNPFRGELFYISSIGEEEAKEFEQIFNGLQGW